MINRPLYAFHHIGSVAIAVGVRTFHTHQPGLRRHTGLKTRCAITTHDARAMRAMAVLIHGIVVMVEHIVAMIGEFFATIPKMVGHIIMTVVDTRIDERHHDVLTLVP